MNGVHCEWPLWMVGGFLTTEGLPYWLEELLFLWRIWLLWSRTLTPPLKNAKGGWGSGFETSLLCVPCSPLQGKVHFSDRMLSLPSWHRYDTTRRMVVTWLRNRRNARIIAGVGDYVGTHSQDVLICTIWTMLIIAQIWHGWSIHLKM